MTMKDYINAPFAKIKYHLEKNIFVKDVIILYIAVKNA